MHIITLVSATRDQTEPQTDHVDGTRLCDPLRSFPTHRDHSRCVEYKCRDETPLDNS